MTKSPWLYKQNNVIINFLAGNIYMNRSNELHFRQKKADFYLKGSGKELQFVEIWYQHLKKQLIL